MRFVLAGLMVLIAGHVVARAQAKIDISGPWILTIQDDKPVTAQVSFKVEGGRLSGHVSSTMTGEQDFVGTIEGVEFEFTFSGDGGQMLFKGTAESNGTLKGTFDSPGTGSSGPFIAKRKE
jgi:hypothetical protein